MASAKLSDEALLAFCQSHPHSRDRLASIIGAVGSRGGDLGVADAAEEPLVEEMRLLGREALQGLADKRVEVTERDVWAVGQTVLAAIAVAIAPASERAFADPKQFRRLHLAQFRPLRAAQNIRETHPPYPLVKACPVHRNLHPGRHFGPDTSRATKTGQITSLPQRAGGCIDTPPDRRTLRPAAV